MKLFQVDRGGYATLVWAKDAYQARVIVATEIAEEELTAHEATQEEINWVRAMGGYIPDKPKKAAS